MNTHYAGLVLLRVFPTLPTVRRVILEHMLPVLREEYVEWSANDPGRMLVHGFLDRGLLIGKWTVWWPNGRIWEQGRCKSDGRTGQWTKWGENGQMWEQGHYESDERVGQWTMWWDNGNIRDQGRYEAGKREGQWEEWYENGQLRKQSHYKAGKGVGQWKFWTEDGKMEIWTHDGVYGYCLNRVKYEDEDEEGNGNQICQNS